MPREEVRPAWRAAVLAYRRVYRVTPEDRIARAAAFEAFCEVLPEMPEERVKVEANHAIAFAAANHTGVVLGRRALIVQDRAYLIRIERPVFLNRGLDSSDERW